MASYQPVVGWNNGVISVSVSLSPTFSTNVLQQHLFAATTMQDTSTEHDPETRLDVKLRMNPHVLNFHGHWALPCTSLAPANAIAVTTLSAVESAGWA